MQKKYMRLHTDDEIENMDRHTILMFLQKHKVIWSEEELTTLSKLQEKLKNLEREEDTCSAMTDQQYQEHIMMIMMMVSCIYDEAAFITNDEYEAINGTPVNIQPPIEKMIINC